MMNNITKKTNPNITCIGYATGFKKMIFKGANIDPIELIDKHGADATRFSAVSLAPLGGRISMEVGDFELGARFVN